MIFILQGALGPRVTLGSVSNGGSNLSSMVIPASHENTRKWVAGESGFQASTSYIVSFILGQPGPPEACLQSKPTENERITGTPVDCAPT